MGGVFTSFSAADESDISNELIEPVFTPKVRHSPERRVEIGLNIIAMHDIDDAHHSFQCNILMHVSWVPVAPSYWAELRATRSRPAKDPEPWFPWIQVHNLHEMVHMYSPEENKGMSKMSDEKVRKLISEYLSKGNFDEPMKPVLESTNFVAKFINTLDLHHFPFDSQKLRITIVSNQTKDVTLTHKVIREGTYAEVPCLAGDGSMQKIKWKFPAESNKPSIKCNLEGDTVSEWNILLHPKDPVEAKAEQAQLATNKNKVVSNSDQAVCIYRFHEHDPKLSAEGAVYQRLDVFVIAEREVRNFLWSVIAPTAALCFASLSVFSISIDASREGVGDRLGILFTIILAIIANSIATQDRLPKVDYFTWADYCLYWMQFLVYLVVVETSACVQLADQFAVSVESLDSVLFYSLIIIFGVSYSIMAFSAFSLHYNRSLVANRYAKLGDKSLQLEEERLFYWENGFKIQLDKDGRIPDANAPRTHDQDGVVHINLRNPN